MGDAVAMDGAGSRIVEVTLPNGATALVRAVHVDGGATKTTFGDRFDFADVAATPEGLRASLVKAAPDTVTVELGLELALKAGKLTGLLVEGEGSGSLAVTLEWQRDGNSRGHRAPDPP
jgi:hypothetical protein